MHDHAQHALWSAHCHQPQRRCPGRLEAQGVLLLQREPVTLRGERLEGRGHLRALQPPGRCPPFPATLARPVRPCAILHSASSACAAPCLRQVSISGWLTHNCKLDVLPRGVPRSSAGTSSWQVCCWKMDATHSKGTTMNLEWSWPPAVGLKRTWWLQAEWLDAPQQSGPDSSRGADGALLHQAPQPAHSHHGCIHPLRHLDQA